MPRSNVPLTNFTSGMWDPKLHGRSDIEQYRNGAKTLTNMIVEWYGGATRIPGTKYIAETETSSEDSTLIPFIYSNVQAYILEFGNLYIRFIKDHAQITDGTTYEVVTTYTASEVIDIQYAQTADVMYLFHKSHHPAQLIRSGDASWALSDIAFEWGPFRDMNTTAANTMNPSATTGVGIDLVSSVDFFVAGHVNALFKMHSGYMKITAVTDAKNAVATVIDDLTASTATADWYEGAFSTYRGFPGTGAFYEDRLVMTKENTVYLSEPGAYEQFEGGADADDSIIDTVNARQLNDFKWIDSGDFLALGNEGGIVRYWSGSDSSPLTPTNKNAKKIAEEGASGVIPISIGSKPYYIGRDGKIMRTLSYALQSDDYNGADVTLLSRSLVDATIIQMAYQQTPHSIIWMITSSGKLISATINTQQKITAFTQHEDTGSYKSIAVIPVTGYDEVYFIVEREVDGSTVKYIEYLTAYDVQAQADQFFVRSGITYDGVTTTTITGLDHLEGETVEVFADGYVQPECTVASGQITIARTAEKVQTGLGYTPVLETLDLTSGSAIGSAKSKSRTINQVYVELYNTMSCKIGREGSMDDVKFALPATLFTGLKHITFPEGWKKDKTVRITQSGPMPLTVNGIYPDMNTND